MLSFFLSRVMCSIVGITVPGYMSFRALETLEPDDEKQWLTYWIIYAAMESFEIFFDWILEWVPLFFELKLCFLLWLMLPGFRGAQRVYDEFIQPFLKKYASKFDVTFRDTGAPPALQRELYRQAKSMAEDKTKDSPGGWEGVDFKSLASALLGSYDYATDDKLTSDEDRKVQ